mmetsp:Transcript_26855/g.75402  ORF Transcript_26855/g.75402 Transcript_26855/m.75402 type:complete len:259 (+) Transcript_26855:822-1598(+)
MNLPAECHASAGTIMKESTANSRRARPRSAPWNADQDVASWDRDRRKNLSSWTEFGPTRRSRSTCTANAPKARAASTARPNPRCAARPKTIRAWRSTSASTAHRACNSIQATVPIPSRTSSTNATARWHSIQKIPMPSSPEITASTSRRTSAATKIMPTPKTSSASMTESVRWIRWMTASALPRTPAPSASTRWDRQATTTTMKMITTMIMMTTTKTMKRTKNGIANTRTHQMARRILKSNKMKNYHKIGSSPSKEPM